MGLDAFVRCNCWRDGKTKPVPVPLELMKIDEEGYFDLTLPYEGNEETYALFDGWCENGCGHEGMQIIHERVCNWGGKRFFLEALERAGIENFPVLWNEFPQSNGGQLSVENARLGLQELHFLWESADLGSVAELVEEGSEEIIFSGEGEWQFKGQQGVILSREALLIMNSKTEKVRFSARRLAQRKLDEKWNEWTNLDTGKRFKTEFSLSIDVPWPDGKWENEQGVGNSRLVEIARWRERPMTPLDLDYIIAPLTRLFQASIEIGNPVCWS